MMLAAHAVGLGSCWINRELQMFSTDEGKALMRRFGLPDGLIGVGALLWAMPMESSVQRNHERKTTIAS